MEANADVLRFVLVCILPSVLAGALIGRTALRGAFAGGATQILIYAPFFYRDYPNIREPGEVAVVIVYGTIVGVFGYGIRRLIGRIRAHPGGAIDAGSGQFILEQRFERRFLYPLIAVPFAFAIMSIGRNDWIAVGICLVACFLIGVIAARLPKNRHKSFSQLARGAAGDIEPPMDNVYPRMPVNRSPAINALAKCSYVAVAASGAMAYHLGQPIAGTMLASLIGVMLIGTLIVATSGGK